MRERRKQRHRQNLIAAAAIAFLAVPVSASPQVSSPAQVSSDELAVLVEQLGSVDYAEREAATQALSRLGPDAETELRSWLRRSNDPEVRHRLRFVLESIRPPDAAVLVVRADPGLALRPGDLVTHVDGRRVQSVAELRVAFERALGSLYLRVRTTGGVQDVGPVSSAELANLSDFRAPRGIQIQTAIRQFAAGFAEDAWETLRATESEHVPESELSTPLRAVIAYTAGDAETARRLLAPQPQWVEQGAPGSPWSAPSVLDLAGPGKAPAYLEWMLWSAAGAPAYSRRSEPDLRVQRVQVPAHRYLDALTACAGYWWNDYRLRLGDSEPTTLTASGNMLAVSAWMFFELDLRSECQRLIEPRSIILRRSGGGPRKWIRVDTDAWLPFLAGDAAGALNLWHDDALDVLARPSQDVNAALRSPTVAATLAFFLYQQPADARVRSALTTINQPGQPGLAEYADWMCFGLRAENAAAVRADLRELLPHIPDAEAGRAARAVILLEYVQDQPDEAVMQAACQRLALSALAGEAARWRAITSALLALRRGEAAGARGHLTEYADDPELAPLLYTAAYLANPPPSAVEHEHLAHPLLAIPAGETGTNWLLLARDRRLVRISSASGAQSPVPLPSASWYPGPVNWPWLGREAAAGRVWAYDRRHIVELTDDRRDRVQLNARPADFSDFARYVGPVFSTLAEAVAESPRPPRENGEFLRGEIRSNAEFVADPDLPELSVIRRLPRDPRVVHVGLRGGPHLLVLPEAERAWSSVDLAAELNLPQPLTFFAQAVPHEASEADPVIYLFTNQGLLRLELSAAENTQVRRIPLPGDEPYPELIPESCPYERRDPRWVYCARLPDEGGTVYRVSIADDSVETLDLVNFALPPDYFALQTRAWIREEIDRCLSASGLPTAEELIRDAAERVGRWQEQLP